MLALCLRYWCDLMTAYLQFWSSLNSSVLDHDLWMASRTAKATLIGAIVFSTLTIWAVHFQQQQERDVGLRSDTHSHSSGFIYFFRRPCTKGCWGTMSVDAKNLGREKRTFVHLNINESGMNRFKRLRKPQMFDAFWREVSTPCSHPFHEAN